MATIKEVAKLANVSLGTASNVLNGKTSNEELISRVEAAMEQLSYHPDANARNLKNMQSALIGVILPDVLQDSYGGLLHDLEGRLREKGYSLLVKISSNNQLIEKKCLESCLEQCVDGIILYSTVKEKSKSVFEKIKVPVILISRNGTPDFIGDRIIIDYKTAFKKALKGLCDQGAYEVGLIMENDLIKDESLMDVYRGFFPNDDLIKIVDSSQERGFQAFFELYTSHPEMGGVIAGSSLIARGIKKAMETLCIKNIPVVAVKESSWIEDSGYLEGQITVSQKTIGEWAVQRLMEAIDTPHTHENITKIINAEFDRIETMKAGIHPADHDIRLAMYDCSSSRSLKMLSQIYEKESGKKIIFDLFSYKELEELLYLEGSAKSSRYDGFMMDITWFEGLIEGGGVQNLDELWSTNQSYFDGFVDGVLKECGMYVESLYAIPFMSGAQILFFQKDLFENKVLKLKYKRKYGEELKPPQTWAQFNLTAEFFTKKYNPQSPVKYGASIPRGENVYTTVSFLSHLWAYGSQVFDSQGKVSINNSNSTAALKNFINSYQFTSGKNLQTWSELAEEFSAGESAMVILYDSDAGDINNYTKSKVGGNLGYALVPGGTPVLGGWSLGVNRYSKHIGDVQNFLLWACGNQNGIPLALLGGSTLRKDYYLRSDLENLEPWKTLIMESYQQSIKRVMPEILDESRWKNNIYTSIIPSEVVDVLKGKKTESEAVENMERRILDLLQ